MADVDIQRDNNETKPKLEGGITGKGFVKGDKRINRKGRPRNFDALRELAQHIGQEPHESGIAKERGWSRIEVILRSWAVSGEPQLQKAFVEIAYGKVKDEIAHSGSIRYEVEYLDDWRNEANQTAEAAFRAKDDSTEQGALQMAERGATVAQDNASLTPGD
jgi:hypothetical protein